MISDIAVSLLVLTGAAFILIAAIGVVRMPDLFLRMHATAKAGSLGAGLILIGVAVYSSQLGVASRALAAVAFILLTMPIGAHLLGRAAYFIGVSLWEESVTDELRGHDDWRTHRLDSEREPSAPEGPRDLGSSPGEAGAPRSR